MVKEHEHVYGPIPSRRLGRSLGVSPIPGKTCNYACNYCMLGATTRMSGERKEWIPLDELLGELDSFLAEGIDYDTVTVCGEGEPTLYSRLGELIEGLRTRQTKPVAVITNSGNMDRPEVRQALMKADIVLPSLEAADEATWRAIHRPSPHISFPAIIEGLKSFAKDFQGQLWLEVMLLAEINDSPDQLEAIKALVDEIKPDRVYVNTPVRPPADSTVKIPDHERIQAAVDILGGIALDYLTDQDFTSAEEDPFQAVLTICKRHPMNRFELVHFLEERGVKDTEAFIRTLKSLDGLETVNYCGIESYRNTRS